MSETVTNSLYVALSMKNVEKRIVMGEVLIPDEVDQQDEIYDADVIENAAHGWMINSQKRGIQHTETGGAVNEKVSLVESYIAPVEFELNGRVIKQGTWIVGYKINDDDLWEDVKAGKYTGFSIGGTALVEKLAE